MMKAFIITIFLIVLINYGPMASARSPAVEPGVIIKYDTEVTTPELARGYDFPLTEQRVESAPILQGEFFTHTPSALIYLFSFSLCAFFFMQNFKAKRALGEVRSEQHNNVHRLRPKKDDRKDTNKQFPKAS